VVSRPPLLSGLETLSSSSPQDSTRYWLFFEAVFLEGVSSHSSFFSQTREREYFLWDSRNMAKPLKSNQLDSSTGTMLPLYDEDSAMLFLGGKVC